MMAAVTEAYENSKSILQPIMICEALQRTSEQFGSACTAFETVLLDYIAEEIEKLPGITDRRKTRKNIGIVSRMVKLVLHECTSQTDRIRFRLSMDATRNKEISASLEGQAAALLQANVETL